jgi:hypothetical protein
MKPAVEEWKMTKKWIKALALALAFLAPPLAADETATYIEPFTSEEFAAVEDESQVTVFEELNKTEQYKNLLDLKRLRFDKYGMVMRFEREGNLAETKGDFGYTGFFEKTYDTAGRQGDALKVPIVRHKHVLFDDVKGITCGKLSKYSGDKVRGKGMIVSRDEEAAEAITVLLLDKGHAIYFESSAVQAKRLAKNLSLLTREKINDVGKQALGIDVSPSTGRVIAAIKGTMLGHVPLYSTLVKLDRKKLKSPDAAIAAKLARNGSIMNFRTENIEIFNSKVGNLEIRVKRGGKK